MWEDFKKFAIGGNVLDLAVAVIIGGAFGKIVTSLVEDILTPFFGILLGGIDFKDLQFPFGNAIIKYGLFVQSVIDFLIISFSIFMFIRLITSLKKKDPVPVVIKETPAPSKEEILLTEIRDLLKQK